MKKIRTNRFIYMAAAFSLLLSGCSKEDSYQESTAHTVSKALSLQVSASAYYSSAGTRASDTGTTTTFTNEDKLGIIVTHKDGSVEHFVYTYDGSSWTSSTPFYYNYQDSYAAYYPYKEDLSGQTLSQVKAAFTPSADQSDYATGYAASDLMTCESAILDKTDWKLQITLTHAFSMLRFSAGIPVKSKCEDDNAYQYSLPATDIVFYIGDTPYKPWMGSDGYARLIVGSNSSSDISVKSSYTFQGKQTETSGTVTSFASGQYYTLIPQVQYLGDYKFSDVRVGDFYCKSTDGQSGFVLPREASLPDELKSNCLGIVYWLGDIKDDNYTLLDSKFSGGTRGLVVSLWDLTDPDNDNKVMTWTYGSSESIDTWLSSTTWSGTKPDDFSSIQDGYKMQGYANTIALQEYNKYIVGHTAAEGESADDYGSIGKKRVKPIVALESFRNDHAVPANTSDWYWPSVYELLYVCTGQGQDRGTSGREMLDEQIGKAGGDSFINGGSFENSRYFTSTENNGDYVFYVIFSEGSKGNVGNKTDAILPVRPILAF